MAGYEEDHHMNPMDEFEKEFIEEEDDDIFNANWFDPSKRGKWMLFYPKGEINEKWRKAVSLYRAEELIGIQSLKSSTSAPNRRAGNRKDGAIRFACGPYDNEESVLSYGRNLIAKMNYKAPNYGFVAYKTDNQSALGTAATGAKRNYYYKIICDTQVSTEKDPSDLQEDERLIRKIGAIASLYPDNTAEVGMWVMVIGKSGLDRFWTKACKIYEDRQLTGISYLKVCPGKEKSNFGALLFFCGPKENETLVKSYGRTLIDKLKYTNRTGKMVFRSYREERETDVLYEIDVPSTWDGRY